MIRKAGAHLIAVIALLLLAGCTTVEKLQSAPTCQVWEPQGFFTPRLVEINGVSAKYKGQCSLMGLACEWIKADYDREGKRVYLEGNSLFDGRHSVATYENDSVIFDGSFWDSFAKTSPAKVDRGTKTVSRTITVTAFGLNKSSQESVSFNDQCSPEQAAMGAVALWAGRSKDRRSF